MRFVVMIFLLATATLAGCSDDAPADDAGDDFDEFEDVDVASDKGIIRGVVVTEVIVPLANATVTLTQTGEKTTTNENGAFLFADLEPGSYILSAGMIGYETIQSSTTVEAGVKDPKPVKILLPTDPEGVPDVVSLQWDGFIECSTSYVAICAVLADVGVSEDDFNHLFDLEPGMDHIQTEMIWESNQDLGANMYYTHRYGTQEDYDAGFYSGTFNRTEGPSPLLLVTHGDQATAQELGAENELNIAIFSGEADGTSNPVIGGPGMTLSQKFTIYLHAFYGYTPPAEWRFSETQEPPPQ